MHSNFMRVHESLRTTPAVVLGVTDGVLTPGAKMMPTPRPMTIPVPELMPTRWLSIGLLKSISRWEASGTAGLLAFNQFLRTIGVTGSS
jgi:hypothetical protein